MLGGVWVQSWLYYQAQLSGNETVGGSSKCFSAGVPHCRPRLSSQSLASAWPNSSCHRHLSEAAADGRSLCVTLLNTRFKKKNLYTGEIKFTPIE